MRNLIEIAIHNSISEKGGQNRRPVASMIDRQQRMWNCGIAILSASGHAMFYQILGTHKSNESRFDM